MFIRSLSTNCLGQMVEVKKLEVGHTGSLPGSGKPKNRLPIALNPYFQPINRKKNIIFVIVLISFLLF